MKRTREYRLARSVLSESKLRNDSPVVKIVFLLSFVIFTITSGNVLAEEGDGNISLREVSKKINLSYRRAPLERVLDRISRATSGINIKVQVEDEEQLRELNRMPITVELSSVSWKTALAFIAKKYRFVVNYNMEIDGVVLFEKPPRITMNVQKAPIENVIKLIASDAKANIIIGPEVQGNVTFSLHDVPWKEALNSILKTHGFLKVEDGSGVIRITTPEKVQAQMEVRVYPLRYISPDGSRYRAVLSSEYVERVGGSTNSNEFSLLAVLEKIKGPEGSISYESRTNQLIVKDTATKLEEIARVIREMDIPPMQVHIKTRILTNTYDADDDFGVKWANGFTANFDKGVSWQTVFPFSIRAGKTGNFGQMGAWSPIATAASGLPIAIDQMDRIEPGGYAGTAMTTSKLSFEQLTATLMMLKMDHTIKILQEPELIAMDNEEATIHIGNIERYAEFYTESTDSGTQSGYRASEPLQLGVQLLVVPHVIRDANKIMLTVIPKTEDSNGTKTFGAGSSNELILPQTKSKTVVTRMMLNNRETGVIAGMVNNRLELRETKVPFLGNLPILGQMFRSKEADPQKENIIFLITPTVLLPNDREEFDAAVAAVRDEAEND